jgi:hypothetical protein
MYCRDICAANLVVDASRMVPGGFHFLRPCTHDGVTYLHFDSDDSDPLVLKSRTRAGPLRYYYIDFGLSDQFSSFEARELVIGLYGQLGIYVPEISDTVPYDAFKVDVRLVGEMLVREFLLVRV